MAAWSDADADAAAAEVLIYCHCSAAALSHYLNPSPLHSNITLSIKPSLSSNQLTNIMTSMEDT
jgi:predicted short-subunit dehydrogenase-like oxidoreductase (DUF2520 family)